MYLIHWMMHVWNNQFNKNSIVNCEIIRHAFFSQIYFCLVIHHVNSCTQLTTLRWTTISNTVMCTLHDFLSSKVRFTDTSTVTGSHSCSEKNYAYASCTSCFCIGRIYSWSKNSTKMNNINYITLIHNIQRDIVGKANQFKQNSLFINLFCLQYQLSQWAWPKIDTLL